MCVYLRAKLNPTDIWTRCVVLHQFLDFSQFEWEVALLCFLYSVVTDWDYGGLLTDMLIPFTSQAQKQ